MTSAIFSVRCQNPVAGPCNRRWAAGPAGVGELCARECERWKGIGCSPRRPEPGNEPGQRGAPGREKIKSKSREGKDLDMVEGEAAASHWHGRQSTWQGTQREGQKRPLTWTAVNMTGQARQTEGPARRVSLQVRPAKQKKGRKKKESRAELWRLGRGQQRDQSDDTLCAVRKWGVQDWQKSKGRIQTGAVEQATSPGQGKLCVKHKGRSSVQVEGWWWTENPSVLLAARKCMSCMSGACTAEP